MITWTIPNDGNMHRFAFLRPERRLHGDGRADQRDVHDAERQRRIAPVVRAGAGERRPAPRSD